MSKKTYTSIFLITLLSLWTTLLSALLVVDIPKHHPTFQFKEKTAPSKGLIEREMDLKEGNYFLKIKHKNHSDLTPQVAFNGRTILPAFVRRRSNNKTEHCFFLFHGSSKSGTLKINFPRDFAEETHIKLRNYRRSYAENNVFVFFRADYSRLPKPVFSQSLTVFALAYCFFTSVFFLPSAIYGKYKQAAIAIVIAFNISLSLFALNNIFPVTPYVTFINSSYALSQLGSLIFLFALMHIVPFVLRAGRRYEIHKNLLSPLPRTTARTLVLILASLTTPFLLLQGKAAHPGLYPVDIFDEATHTYTEIPIVQKALLAGHILKMNLFNNFGTPLLGDPVANPFALHSITYFFFKPHIAMIVNKIVLSIATFLVLFCFYRRRTLSFYSSILSAFLTFTAPAFFWFYQDHPHQGVLLYFSLILLLVDVTYCNPRIIYYIFLYLSFAAFLLSSGVIGIALGMPFLAVFTLILTRFNIQKIVRLFLLPLISASILIHPHILYFFKIAPLTWRAGFSFEKINPYSFKDLLLGCTFLSDITHYHTDCSISYSFVILLFALLGLLTYRKVKTDVTFALSIVLGLIPFLFVVVLLRYRWIQSSIPIIKPIDATRILWFATVFFMIPFGLMFDGLATAKIPTALAKHLLYVLVPLTFICAYLTGTGKSLPDIFIYVISPSAIFLVYLILAKYQPDNKSAFKLFSILLFVLLLAPRTRVYNKLVNFCYNTEEMMSYMPLEFVDHMKPYYRLATTQLPRHLDPSSSSDQKIAKHNILGSAGRSIIAHGPFRAFLEKNDLISCGSSWRELHYNFKPAPPAKLSPLGIRYFVAESEKTREIENLGWQKTLILDQMQKYYPEIWLTTAGISSVKGNGLTLFENPLRPSPFYYVYENQINFIHDYKFHHDRIEIDIPPVGHDNLQIVATFIAWPGWRAWLDNKPVDISAEEDQFIRIDAPNGKKLVLEFAPYSDRYIVIGFICSFVFMGICCLYLYKKPSGLV